MWRGTGTSGVEVSAYDQKTTFGDQVNGAGELVQSLVSQPADVVRGAPGVLIKIQKITRLGVTVKLQSE